MNQTKKVGYFRLARKESLKSTHDFKVGAVLVSRKPISVGHNVTKTHPKFSNPNLGVKTSIHAEINCLLHSEAGVAGATMYIYRETKDGEPALSRPCPECLEHLRDFGIKCVYYSVPHAPFWCSEKL